MLRRAVQKVESVLPISPRKWSKVVKELMYVTCDNNPSGVNKEGRPSLDNSLAKKVTQFY